ncbi:FxSxx-COOH system tetratricopeptide repeat protein [Catenulispora rubra]|uniref:FxSxx-COOH system tetratricopeptide repeat protein n=1 Tax=Catenulispora rubra TaxID=280293 RepID=UPI001891F4C9|nr:FxSxx-COOH system tetratricopeptide repeat protein [Catenulispora rubra]
MTDGARIDTALVDDDGGVTMTGSDAAGGRIVTFYSYKGGTGRTMALANAAWILAAAGHRVLMIDWDLEAPGLHRFFEPFLGDERLRDVPGIINMIDQYCDSANARLTGEDGAAGGEVDPVAWWAENAHVAENAVELDWDFEFGGSLHFIRAGRTAAVHSAGISAMDWYTFYHHLGGNAYLEQMRLQLKQAYDYVLIDSRTGNSDIEDICTKDLPDDLVVCFTLSGQNIDGTAEMATDVDEIRGADRRRPQVRILPVVTRVDDSDSDRRDTGLAVAQARFAPFVNRISSHDPKTYWNLAQIPYKALYSYEELLAVFGDSPGNPQSVLAAVERLVGLITEGQVTSLAPMDEGLRLRHRQKFFRRAPVALADVCISHLAADRTWVAWLRWLLRGAGLETSADETSAADGRALDPLTAEQMRSAPYTLVLVSGAYQQSALGRSVWASRNNDVPTQLGKLVALHVEPPVPGSALRWSPAVETVNRTEVDVAGALLAALSSPMTAEQALTEAERIAPRVRYPRSRPDHWKVPNRVVRFTGRVDSLDRLRQQLTTATGGDMTHAVLGISGIGKTALVVEYAHRFQHHYDVVWWIRAEHLNFVTEDLAELARRLGLEVQNVGEAADAVREDLRAGRRGGRWLLVYDNAEDPDQLLDRMPSAANGHVLVTSNNSKWASAVAAVEIEVFDLAESIDLLTSLVPGLSEQHAELVAVEVGNLPLAVEIAGSWLAETGMPVEAYLELLRSDPAATLERGHASGYDRSIITAWRLTVAKIGELSPGAERLLQLLAFCGPEPVAANLVYGDAMSRALLPYDSRLRSGKGPIGQYVQLLNSFGLVTVPRGTDKPLQVHRLIQQVVRDTIPDPADRETLRRAIHEVLVAARPPQGDVDNAKTWPVYAEIWPHLVHSEARRGSAETRQLYVDRVRHLRLRGEPGRAAELAEETVALWEADPDIGPDDARNLSMRFELATALRALGDPARSLEIDTDVLARQRSHPDLGPEHLATLMTVGGLASDHRALGRFQESLALDRANHADFLTHIGRDHPRTLLAASNLAVALRAAGEPFEALKIDRQTLEDRRDVLGETDFLTFKSAINLARDLRDCGDRTGALELLKVTYRDAREALGDDAPATIEAARALSTSYRKAGDYTEAGKLLDRLREKLGAPESVQSVPQLGYALNAAAHRAGSGDVQGALDLALTTLKKYQARQPHHPDTMTCANNVAIYLRRLGRTQESLDRLRGTFSELTAALGRTHLSTLGCAINLANALAETGHLDEAEKLYLATAELLRTVLAPAEPGARESHPDLLACQANLAVTWHETSREEQAETERARVRKLLAATRGEKHPSTARLDRWERADRELDATPL